MPPPPAVSAARRPELPTLTAVRFLAALHIVFYHFSGDVPYDLGPLFILLSKENRAVELFFVLSGFILSYNYLGRLTPSRRAFRSFLAARLARICPAYLLAFLLSAPAVVTSALARYPRPEAALKLSLAGAASLVLLQSWLPRLASFWNYPGWSLSVELFFYLCFPFFAPRITRHTLAGCAKLFALCIAVTLAAAALLSAPFVHVPPQIEYFPLLRLPEFLLGAIAGQVFLLRRHLRPLPSLAVLALAAPLGISFFAAPYLPRLVLSAALAPVFAAAIYLTARARDPLSLFPRLKPITLRLGESSYAFYILQWPLFALAGLSLPEITLQMFLLYTLGLLLASLATFQFVEKPSRPKLRRLLDPERDEAAPTSRPAAASATV